MILEKNKSKKNVEVMFSITILCGPIYSIRQKATNKNITALRVTDKN